jgi:ATP-binding cassette, subfamily B, bacterial
VTTKLIAPPEAGGWLRRLRPLLFRHRRNLVLSFFGSLVGMGATVITPLVLRDVIDAVAGGRSASVVALGLLLALGLVRFGAAVARRLYAGRVSYDVEYDLRNVLYEHLQRLDFAAHDRLETGQAVSRAGSDVRMVQMLLAFLPLMVGNLIMLGLSLAVMAVLSPALTLVALVVLPALAAGSARMRDRVFPATWDAQQKAADVAGVVEEAVTGVRVVKAFAAEERELARLEGKARALFASRMRNVAIQARLVPFIQTLPNLGLAALLLFGGNLVLDGRISLGTFLAFNSYLLQLAAPARMLTMVMAAGQMARAGAVRILELLDSSPRVTERDDARPVVDVAGDIAFSDVHFAYSPGTPRAHAQPLLDGFSLRIRPGERVALVGPSGSGKSTIALLLPRFYDVDGGAVTLDGLDVRDLRLDDLRRSIGVVFEDAFLFSASIRDNIAYGRPDATDEQVRAAAEAAEADEFIEVLPLGYDTVVGERGLTLSGGQRQRITLARALLTDPRILVLDDATSSVDPTVEAGIHATLRRLMAGRTTVIVAHRPSTVALADRVVMVDEGRVVADGTHASLLAGSARYRELLGGESAGGLGGVGRGDLGSAGQAPPYPSRSEFPPSSLAGRSSSAAAGAGHAAQVVGSWVPGRVGGMGMRGGHGFMEAMVGDEKLAAQVAALPPAVEEPDIDPVAAAGPDPDFRLSRFVRPWRGILAVGGVLVAIDALAGLAGPALVRAGVAGGVQDGRRGALVAASAAFALVALVDWWALWAGARWTGRLSERLLYALRIKVFAHLGRLGLDFYEREMAGRIMTRMTSDIEALAHLFQQGLVTLVVAGLTAFGVAVALFILDWRLATAAMTVVPPLAILTWWFRRNSDAAYARVRDKVAGVMASLQEGLSGVRVTQAFARQDRNYSEFRQVAGEHLDARLEGNRLSATYFPAVELLGQVATVVVVGYGAGLVRGGSLTPADLIAFVLYLNLFFAPVTQLSQVFDVAQQAKAATAKLAELLATPVSVPDRPGAAVPARLTGALRLEGVRFRYPGELPWALDGVDLALAPGETVALVGRTGAGKSTVVKLLARFYDPTEGRVTADGVALSDLSAPGYRRHLGLVPQEAHLFSGTVFDNIAYGRPEASAGEVEAAARAVGAHDFVASLPDGYATVVSERGRSLSSGQRQLLALARARLVDPSVLLLDEATSNLDLATEARVQRAMGVLSEGRTTVIVAHRLATAARADRIVVLDAGRIAEEGTHTELLARGGLYTAMWRAGDPEAEPPGDDLLEPTG